MRRHGAFVEWARAAGLCAGVLAGFAAVATAQTQPMSPQHAMRLLTLDDLLHEIEAEALASAPAYQSERQRVEALETALAEHRAAYERQRDADDEYVAAKTTLESLKTRKAELDRDLAHTTGQHLDALRTARQEGGKASRLRREIAKLDQRRKLHQDRYDLISTTTATTMAGYAYLEEKISELEAQIATLQRSLDSVAVVVDDAKARQRAAEEQLKPIRAELLEVKAALSKAEPAYNALEAKWEGQYRGSPRTLELESDLEAARRACDAARKVTLSKLRRADPQYARLWKERITIRPFED